MPRHQRFGIPKVNQNPRPPNEARPRGGPGGGQQQKRAGDQNLAGQHAGDFGGRGQGQGGGGQGGQGGAQGGGSGGGGAGKPKLRGMLKKLMKLENAPIGPQPTAVAGTQTLNQGTVQNQLQNLGGNPANALAFSSFTPGPGQVDPRDATYWQNVNNLLFNTQGQLAQGQLAQTREDIDYQAGFSDMETNRGQEQRRTAEDAMRRGLANSGYLDVRDAEQTRDYLRDVEEYQTGYTRDRADRGAMMSQAIQDYISGEGELSLDAITRFTEMQQDRAADEAPLYAPEDIQKLQRILRTKKKKKSGGGSGGGNGGGGGGGGSGGGGNRGGGGGGNNRGGKGKGKR